MLHALILIPAHDPRAEYWAVSCWQYCMRHGYKPLAIVHDWADVVHYFASGVLPVIVSAHRGHLPVDRLPRFEAVSEEPRQPRRARRTRRM